MTRKKDFSNRKEKKEKEIVHIKTQKRGRYEDEKGGQILPKDYYNHSHKPTAHPHPLVSKNLKHNHSSAEI